MKKYTSEPVKLIVLAIIVPVLVMAYTSIEKSVTASADKATVAVPLPVTPVSIKFIDNVQPAKK